VPAQQDDIWRPFVRAAVGFALTAGFGLGGVLFAAPALGFQVGGWWLAMAQVHAHVQLFGSAGLMVLGVAFYFLPGLRGRRSHTASGRPWCCGCWLAGCCYE
jgi:nitric oxide reductase large subunit